VRVGVEADVEVDGAVLQVRAARADAAEDVGVLMAQVAQADAPSADVAAVAPEPQDEPDVFAHAADGRRGPVKGVSKRARELGRYTHDHMSRPETALRARLLGPLTFRWGGEPVRPPSRKAAWLLALVDDIVACVTAGERLRLHGLGGVGKSALAAAVVRTVSRRGPGLWLTLGEFTPESAFDAIASALDGGDVPGGAALIVTGRVRYPALVRIDVPPLDRAVLNGSEVVREDPGDDAWTWRYETPDSGEAEFLVRAVDTEGLDSTVVAAALAGALGRLASEDRTDRVAVNLGFVLLPCSTVEDFRANRDAYPRLAAYAAAVASVNGVLAADVLGAVTVWEVPSSDPLRALVAETRGRVGDRTIVFVASRGNFGLPYAMAPAAWEGVIDLARAVPRCGSEGRDARLAHGSDLDWPLETAVALRCVP